MVKNKQGYEITIKPGLQKTEMPKSVDLTEASASEEAKGKTQQHTLKQDSKFSQQHTLNTEH